MCFLTTTNTYFLTLTLITFKDTFQKESKVLREQKVSPETKEILLYCYVMSNLLAENVGQFPYRKKKDLKRQKCDSTENTKKRGCFKKNMNYKGRNNQKVTDENCWRKTWIIQQIQSMVKARDARGNQPVIYLTSK